MDENEEEKRISRIEGIMEQRKDLNYDFDRARKRIELTDFLSEHKKDFIIWLKEEGYDVEKIQYITNGDYREHYCLHESFSKYYLEKQKAKYKDMLEESLGDTEKYNIVLNRALHKKNKFEYLRIFTSSLQPEELEQMGIINPEKYLTEVLFHSLYTFFQNLLIEHRLNCQKIPNKWRPEIFKIQSDNKDEVSPLSIKEIEVMTIYPKFKKDYEILIENNYMRKSKDTLQWLKSKQSLSEYFGHQKKPARWKPIENLFNIKDLKNSYSTNGSQTKGKSADYEELLKILPQNVN